MTSNDSHLFHGIHIFGEMYDVSKSLLDDLEVLEKALREGIEKSGATICSVQSKKFDPSGVTLLALLSESHASIHTYPDEGSLFFDAFTCGTTCQPSQIATRLVEVLRPSHHSLQTMKRGISLDSPLKPFNPQVSEL